MQLIHTHIIFTRIAFVLLLMLANSSAVFAQSEDNDKPAAQLRREGKKKAKTEVVTLPDSIELATVQTVADSLSNAMLAVTPGLTADSIVMGTELKNEKFLPDPKKCLWMAIVLPGGGQIYNRKYWKLPLIYGGFLGCAYALTWNNTMYRDYSQAYIDIMDSDPNSKSYENFIPRGYDIDANMARLQDLFKRKKNFYRRYRDMSVFCMIGVYALSIVDAYVDAEMSSFDISPDLSLKVSPTIINDRHTALRASGHSGQSYGLQCSISF